MKLLTELRSIMQRMHHKLALPLMSLVKGVGPTVFGPFPQISVSGDRALGILVATSTLGGLEMSNG